MAGSLEIPAVCQARRTDRAAARVASVIQFPHVVAQLDERPATQIIAESEPGAIGEAGIRERAVIIVTDLSPPWMPVATRLRRSVGNVRINIGPADACFDTWLQWPVKKGVRSLDPAIELRKIMIDGRGARWIDHVVDKHSLVIR